MENLTTQSTDNVTTDVSLYAKQNIEMGPQGAVLGVALFALVFILIILWIYIGNGLAIYLMVTNECFKNPGNYVKCAYAVDDILMNTFTNVFELSVILSR